MQPLALSSATTDAKLTGRLRLSGAFVLGRYRVRSASSAAVARVENEAVPLRRDRHRPFALLASTSIRLRHRLNVSEIGDGSQPQGYSDVRAPLEFAIVRKNLLSDLRHAIDTSRMSRTSVKLSSSSSRSSSLADCSRSGSPITWNVCHTVLQTGSKPRLTSRSGRAQTAFTAIVPGNDCAEYAIIPTFVRLESITCERSRDSAEPPFMHIRSEGLMS